MSSLSQQLKAIGEKNASVAVDRKSRQEVHSRSLLFDAKTAAGQDYDYIHLVALEGLDELVLIDSRFEKFNDTLFSETSLTFDRDTQTKDVLDHVNRNLAAFMNLVAPYYNLAPALKAVEWLVRRYHINIHNAELMYLSTLPYHSLPVFTRFLNVVPKKSVPLVFSWMSGYKEQLKPLPASSVLKAFHNDPLFFKLYSHYLAEQVKHKTVYKEQLVFYLSNTAQVLASQSRDTARLNEQYIPIVLETVAALLREQKTDFKYSSTLAADIKLSAYAIISVLCSVAPLADELLFSLTRSILQDKSAWSLQLTRQMLIVLGQLWNFYNEDLLSLSVHVFADLPVDVMLDNQPLIMSLIDEDYHLSKFLFFYTVDCINHGNDKALKLLEYVGVSKSTLFFNGSVSAILGYVANGNTLSSEGRSSAILIFELLVKLSKDKLLEVLKSHEKSIGDLEMLLMHTLGEAANDSAYEGDYDDITVDATETESANNNGTGKLKITAKSYLDESSSEEFAKVAQTLLTRLSQSVLTKKGKNHLVSCCRSIFSRSEQEVLVSFLIRFALTPSIPLLFRLIALGSLPVILKDVCDKKQNVHLYLLAPIILLGMTDQHKSFRDLCIYLLSFIKDQSAAADSSSKELFMKSQIYGVSDDLKMTIISPKDGATFMNELFAKGSVLEDVAVDANRMNVLLYKGIFKSSKSNKKFGLLLKMFLHGQWSLSGLPLVLKTRAWKIVGNENVSRDGLDERSLFFNDVKAYTDKCDKWSAETVADGLDFKTDVQQNLVNLVGGKNSGEKRFGGEIEWLLKALSVQGNLQVVADKRITQIFPLIQSTDLKLRICGELIDLLVNDNDILLKFDPMETLQGLEFSNQTIIALLGTVNIVTEVPQQSVAKRRRRSSSSTQKNMAREDINNMAATHLRRLSIILDVLENLLRHSTKIADSELLKTLFKILTDLDYLGNDGKLPILYAQETLASCMLLCVMGMKETYKKGSNIDSNSIRADLIVNSIRHSQSPQVQNRLLLVIAELASLAPEIILHSVMPIFTFMGAHTVRQDDEFSSSALQQTISKVVPAITKASGSLSNEIEFLLTSFVAAFHHIPRHRRVKLFVSLVDTLGHENSLHVILYLIGYQYSGFAVKNRTHECESLLDFVTAMLKTFDAPLCLVSISKFFELWSKIPDSALSSDSKEYAELSARPIFGSGLVSSSDKELSTLKCNLVKFLNNVLGTDEDLSATTNVVSLKMKVALVLFDPQVGDKKKQNISKLFNQVNAFILGSLDTYTNLKARNNSIADELYRQLRSLLNLLPMSFYITSITGSLRDVKDNLSISVAKNFALLAGTKFENEMNASTLDETIESSVIGQLLPILVAGVKKHDNTELVQVYLDTFSTIINKLATASPDIATSNDAKMIIDSLKVITSQNGLLNKLPEVVVSSLNAIASVIRVFGVKCIGYFPKILPPAFKIWGSTKSQQNDDESGSDSDDDEKEANMLLQGSVLMLLSTLIKKMPAFITSSLKQIISTVLTSSLIDGNVRSSIMALVVEHVDKAQTLQCLCNLALQDNFYSDTNAENLGLYLSAVRLTVDSMEKKTAIGNSTLFMRWLIKSFEFRTEYGEASFSDNTIHSIENSFHQCGIAYVMKLNDKSFRPLFANLVRWAANGEGAMSKANTEVTRVTAFFRFFNKLQDRLRSIITSYFSYLLDPTIALLGRFASGDLKETNLRRLMLHSLTSSFKYDQVDYWSHQSRFDTVVEPLLGQLRNIEPSIGKYLVKAITSFITDVTSDEYNEKLVHGLIRYISNEHDNLANTKIWTVRVLKEVFQKMGEQWLSFLPTFIPYIAELLEDEDEAVELEVRKDLVRVIENVLGEPLERYLS